MNLIFENWNKFLNEEKTRTVILNYIEGRMRTPFIKLTVGNWCHKLPGILNGIQLTWQKDYPWEVKGDPNGSGLILPHALDVNVSFTPVHQAMPEKSFRLSDDPNKFSNTPFIHIPQAESNITQAQSQEESEGIVEVDPLIFNEDATRDLRTGMTFEDGNPVMTPTAQQYTNN